VVNKSWLKWFDVLNWLLFLSISLKFALNLNIFRMELLWKQVKDVFSLVPFSRHIIEAAIVALIIYQVFFRRRKAKEVEVELTEAEKDERIAQWEPEPLVPKTNEIRAFDNVGDLIDGRRGKTFKIKGKEYANLATSNFLCFVGNEKIEVSLTHLNPTDLMFSQQPKRRS
jgi:hypothetical protein